MQYSGVVFSKSRRNSIRAKCKINFNVEGINASYGLNLYSPLVTSFEISKYGSNQLRAKLNHIPALDLSAGRLQEPIIKGRNYKLRSAKYVSPSKISDKKSGKGKVKKGQYQLD